MSPLQGLLALGDFIGYNHYTASGFWIYCNDTFPEPVEGAFFERKTWGLRASENIISFPGSQPYQFPDVFQQERLINNRI